MLLSALDAVVEDLDVRGDRHRVTTLSEPLGPPGTPLAIQHESISQRLGTGPQAYYAEALHPGATTGVHFHEVDQFQVFVEGDQRIGRHRAAPVFVHYTDAFTPYGPIVGDDTGSHYLTYRARYDPGARFMPDARDERRWVGGRHLSASRAPDEPGHQVLIEPHRDGLHCEAIRLDPGGTHIAHRAAGGAGRAFVVVAGALVMEGQAHPALSSVWVVPGEQPPALVAGADGVTVVVLGFPEISAVRPNDGLR